jgi:hypothetical protein
VAPVAKQQFLNNNGVPLANGRLYVYAAGTTTPVTIYSDAALTTPALNAAVCACSNLDSSGRFTYFLASSSYRFTLKTSADVLVWDVDGVASVPPASINLDLLLTAGEALSANQCGYSRTARAKTAGRLYKCDSTNTYSSTLPGVIGITPVAIALNASGYLRVSGQISGLAGFDRREQVLRGGRGALTATAPINARNVATADSVASIVVAVTAVAPIVNTGLVCGRLTLTTGTPVTTTDVTAATTVFYTPMPGCNQITLWNGTATIVDTLTETSIAVPATTSQMYDVFAFDNAGAVNIELLAWTNDTTRATAITVQNGFLCKAGAPARRYVGSFRTTTVSGQTEDSAAKRLRVELLQPRPGACVCADHGHLELHVNTFRQAAPDPA